MRRRVMVRAFTRMQQLIVFIRRTYSRWIAMQNDPSAVFLLLIFLLLLLFVVYIGYRTSINT